MNERKKDVYDWVHEKQAPKIKQMGLGEILIYYLTRRKSGSDKLSIGPSAFINILIGDRLEELQLKKEDLDVLTEEEVRELARKKL